LAPFVNAEPFMRLLPREEEFFDLFIEVARRCTAGAEHLRDLFAGPTERQAYHVEAIKRLEHEADQITHEVVNRLDRTFITPLDREDIHRLASDLDDVIDRIDSTARRVQIFKLTDPPSGVVHLADVIYRVTQVMGEAVAKLRNDHQAVIALSIETKKLEEEGDAQYQQILERLFEEERDPVRIIKWKEIYDNLEGTIDQAEDVANDLESIALKHD
jgi:predicted phosphate transport protein (TIGR00153 family)